MSNLYDLFTYHSKTDNWKQNRHYKRSGFLVLSGNNYNNTLTVLYSKSNNTIIIVITFIIAYIYY